MSEVILIPGSHHWFALSKRWEINILTVVHNVRTFMAINICSFRGLLPLETEPGHPLAGCIERNQFADVVTLYHLRFIHKIDDSLGRNVCPSTSNVSKQLLDKFGVVKEGIAAGVCILMIWKCRPIANEISAPHLKSLTTANALPKSCGSIISSLCPSSARCVD